MSFSWQQIWGQALSHSLHLFGSTLGADRYSSLLICLFTFIPDPVPLWLSLSLCALPGSLRWLLLQSGNILCHLTVIISPKTNSSLPEPDCCHPVCMACFVALIVSIGGEMVNYTLGMVLWSYDHTVTTLSCLYNFICSERNMPINQLRLTFVFLKINQKYIWIRVQFFFFLVFDLILTTVWKT